MRKLILFNMVTLDGFFEGPNHDINWHTVDEEFNDFAIQQLDGAGGLIFGRVTYQLMESYWPTTGAVRDDPQVAGRMNALPKYVFSKTLDRAEWNNTRLVSGDAGEEIRRLKQQPGGDLFVFGSANLARTLVKDNLIEEYRLMFSPQALGRGTPLFQALTSPLRLALLIARPFKNGNVLLTYQLA